MTKAVSKRAEAEPKGKPQLLDTKSDYNNYSNLSYFISQYKRAVEIIDECETFYSNFLRNKLFSYEQLKNTPGINWLSFNFSYYEYQKNILSLYKYFVYKTLEKEFKKNGLTLYQCKPCKSETLDSRGCVIKSVFDGDFNLEAKPGALIVDQRYLNTLINGFCHNRYEMTYKPNKHYRWGDTFDDKILVRDGDNDEYARKHNDVDEFILTGEDSGKTIMSNKKERHFKTVKLERYTYDYNWSNKKETWKPQGIYDTFALFGDQEFKLFEVLREYRKKYSDVQYDMFINPSKYIDLWKEYTEKYILDDGVKAKAPGTYYVHHKNEKSENLHKGMLAPVDYMLGPSGWRSQIDKNFKKKSKAKLAASRVNGHVVVDEEEEEDEYIYGDYSIDAVNFLNFESLKAKNPEDSISNILYNASRDRDSSYRSYYTEIKNYERMYLKQAKLQRHIESIHSETTNAANLNIDLLINSNDNWYYILIDNTPYAFTDCLSSVEIEYDEEDNKLNCDFSKKTRRKKAPWPGWMPWVVTEHYYKLVFDCKTNEPIEYSYGCSQHEEKSGD